MQDREQQHSRVLKQEKDVFVYLLTRVKKEPRGREEEQHIRPKTTLYEAACSAIKAKNMQI